MKRFRLSREAARDIRDLWWYVAQENPAAARQLRLQIYEACRKLAANPGMGHRREDLTDKPVLFWPVSSYVIVYNPAGTPVEIVRVLHGARDIPSLL